MIDRTELYQEIQSVAAMLDREETPDCQTYLTRLLADAEDEEIDDSPYEIAGTLLGLDRPLPLPPVLISFITDLYESEIADGNDEAMNDLGAQYYDGSRGFAQSYEKAMLLYQQAAARGNRQAQENLGYCYYYGRVGQPDYEKAFHCFALGAFDGHLISLYKIGDMYLNGLYVEQNEREAFCIFMRCIETMTPQAEGRVAGPVYLRLGRMFLNGLGTERDPRSALVCFQKAEVFLYDMVAGGDAMYRGSLRAAIDGQAAARAALAEALS